MSVQTIRYKSRWIARGAAVWALASACAGAHAASAVVFDTLTGAADATGSYSFFGVDAGASEDLLRLGGSSTHRRLAEYSALIYSELAGASFKLSLDIFADATKSSLLFSGTSGLITSTVADSFLIATVSTGGSFVLPETFFLSLNMVDVSGATPSQLGWAYFDAAPGSLFPSVGPMLGADLTAGEAPALQLVALEPVVVAVPEPGMLAMSLAALGLMAAFRRRA